jgi:hypothetical protein
VLRHKGLKIPQFFTFFSLAEEFHKNSFQKISLIDNFGRNLPDIYTINE